LVLAIAGCSHSTPPSTTATTAPATVPTPTVKPLGAPALGDGGRIVVAVTDNTVATIVSINPDGSDPKKLTDSKTFDGCPRSRARQSHRVLQGAGAFL
jgi:hypothetical protein